MEELIKKKCSKCKALKSLHKFYTEKCQKDGHSYICKECAKLRAKTYAEKHSDELREKRREKYWQNPEKRRLEARERRFKNPQKEADIRKKYREKNRDKIRERARVYYWKNREECLKRGREYKRLHSKKLNQRSNELRRNNEKHKINHRISTAIKQTVSGRKNGRKWQDLVGYSLKDLIKHLKKTVPNDYTWQDYLTGELHLDHIIPKSVFNFTTPDHIDFKRCWALKNLRLLPAEKNMSKHDKLEKPFQPSLGF